MRFDVYPIPTGGSPGFLVDVQPEFLSYLETRVVIPLLGGPGIPKAVRDLHPVFEIDGRNYILATHQLASIKKLDLQRAVASLADHQDEITRALDLLLTGF